ncbi:MAG TPA: type IV toxin-antitoxin system AbiEi family antitoxin domain-containing protein [Acidimicrobiales bacterium]
MTRTAEQLARRQSGVLTLDQLGECGFSRQMISYRVRAGDLIRLAPRIYALAGFPSSWQRQYKAAELSLDNASLAGLAAAKVQEFDGFGVARPELVIAYTANHRTPLASVHRSDTALTTCVSGFRVTTIAQTLCDLLPRVPLQRWERACDGLLLEGRLAIEDLIERRDAYQSSRRPGIALLKALVDDRVSEGWEAAESELEVALHRAVDLVPGCPPVYWQFPAPWDREAQRVDGFIPDWRLILEADGRRWHARVKDFDRDRWRDNRAVALGLRVMRFTHSHLVHRLDEVVSLIADAGRTAERPAA